jgi:hypothetical protein
MKISLTTNRIAKELTKEINIGGKVQPVLLVEDPSIYDKIALYYFNLLKSFKERGVDIDIHNVVNEPDFDKQYYYGYSDPFKGTALIFAFAIPRLRAMIADPNINKFGIKMPMIMGPSNISPGGCIQYLRYYRQNYTQAWNEIDIIAYHQYTNGTNEANLATIKAESEGKQIYQSEMHTNRGDALGSIPIDSIHRGMLSMASLIGTSVRNGANAWLYFQTNYPQVYSPGGLFQADWQGEPKPYAQYYIYKQLLSSQPAGSHVVTRTLTDFQSTEVFGFRKKNEDTLYLHVANFTGSERNVPLEIKGQNYSFGIKGYKHTLSDGGRQEFIYDNKSFSTSQNMVSIVLPPYSVNTFKVIMDTKNTTNTEDKFYNQPIQFTTIGKQIRIKNLSQLIGVNTKFYAMNGQLVYSHFSNNLIEDQIDFSDKPSGMYLFIIDHDGRKHEGKIYLD